jgi:hypothetical protein
MAKGGVNEQKKEPGLECLVAAAVPDRAGLENSVIPTLPRVCADAGKLSKAALSEEVILGWCDGYFEGHKRWPTQNSGLVYGGGERTWAAVNPALRLGWPPRWLIARKALGSGARHTSSRGDGRAGASTKAKTQSTGTSLF